MLWYDFCTDWYLPSNGTDANVVLHYLYLHFQGQTFSYYALVIKMHRQRMAPGRFASTRTAPAVELLLFVFPAHVLPFSRAPERAASKTYKQCRNAIRLKTNGRGRWLKCPRRPCLWNRFLSAYVTARAETTNPSVNVLNKRLMTWRWTDRKVRRRGDGRRAERPSSPSRRRRRHEGCGWRGASDTATTGSRAEQWKKNSFRRHRI